MAIDGTTPRTRRAVLAGGVAAAAAASLGRGQPAAAGIIYVQLGTNNSATTPTGITMSTANIDAFATQSYGTGTAITGQSTSGIGVFGGSDSNTGVYARNSSSTLPAAYCESSDNTGLQGFSGITTAPASPAKTGVYGSAHQDASACGVAGETTAGLGVRGIATSGVGVFGVSDSGAGVKAFSSSSSAVFGQSDTGYALEAVGRLKLSTAGIATIPAGSTSKAIISYLLTAGSFLLLTPGVDIGSRRLWFTKNVAAHTITIHLSSSRTTATKISWLLRGRPEPTGQGGVHQ